MGYFFEIDSANDVLRITWEEPLTDQVVSEGVAAGRTFLVSHRGIRLISDFSGVKKLDVSGETVRTLAGEETHGEERSVVVTVAPADIVFGLARMFSILTEERRPDRHVVRTMREAYALLGIAAPQFTRIDVD